MLPIIIHSQRNLEARRPSCCAPTHDFVVAIVRLCTRHVVVARLPRIGGEPNGSTTTTTLINGSISDSPTTFRPPRYTHDTLSPRSTFHVPREGGGSSPSRSSRAHPSLLFYVNAPIFVKPVSYIHVSYPGVRALQRALSCCDANTHSAHLSQ